jgi:4-alpha-glucanotransferase
MKFGRSSGILLNPTSLPGRFGIGDLGVHAYRFVDMLIKCKQKLWQIFPLGPIGHGNSPYQSFSAFAGNPLLISIEKLAEKGLLSQRDLQIQKPFGDHRVDYRRVFQTKSALFKKAHKYFSTAATSSQLATFNNFCRQQQDWLEDYALFMALNEYHNGAAWNTWEKNFVIRNPKAINNIREQLKTQSSYYKFLQYLFFDQWLELKAYANRHSIKIIGDIPIFVSFHSVDAWSHPELFFFDDAGNPQYVAGVPPDYFSSTGQLWGNPLYRWDHVKEQGYRWWIARFARVFEVVDIVRVDHFRGFAAYWSVPASEQNAINGRWEPGPGEDFFRAVENELGKLPIIAEDLGMITPDVITLRDAFGFPGMKILQFAFESDANNVYLPHTYQQNCVVYTGTHDNNTTLGWYLKCSNKKRKWINTYLNTDGNDICWDLIRAAWASVADMAIIPLQDMLQLGREARMNTPGTTGKNWDWRFTWDMVTPDIKNRLKTLTQIYAR